MATPKQMLEQQQSQMQRVKTLGIISGHGSPPKEDKEEDMSRSVLAMFRAKEEEIQRKKMEVRDKVHAQLGRAEEATKRLAEIREVSRINISKLFYLSAKLRKWFIIHCKSYSLYLHRVGNADETNVNICNFKHITFIYNMHSF